MFQLIGDPADKKMTAKGILLVGLFGISLTGCAGSSVMPLSADTVQISSFAAPVCGAAGAQRVAFERAAIETINRGFDRFVVLDAAGSNNVSVVETPGSVTTTGTVYGSGQFTATSVYNPGIPMVVGTHDQALIVRMFRDGDPAGANAISARETLGPDWEVAITLNPVTCG